MRPGDLVEFKAGAHGIEAPDNVGIYLDRVKRKGDFFVVLFTVKGRKEFRRERVGQVRISSQLARDVLASDDALQARLRQLRQEAASGAHQEAQRIAEEARDRDLWRKLDGQGREMTVGELAGALFETASPKGAHIDAVRAILESCQRPGVGYFARAPGRDEKWRPLSVDEYRRITKEREGLQALRNKLVRVEEVEEEGRVRTVHQGVPVAEANLAPDDHARLTFVGNAMADFVLHDRFTGTSALADTPVHTIDGWNLLDYLRFLAHDWTGSRASASSAFVEFLLGTRQWTEHEALVTIAKRKVLASGDFSWELDAGSVRESERFPPQVPDAWAEGRSDLRNLECYTIDPPDAKDFDDAVGVERASDGSWTLWVHIADVAHYVAPGTSLDRAARQRATSLYLPTGVLPMLPPRLSDDLCSLRASQNRVAMTVELHYGPQGEPREARFHESMIQVRQNLHYGQVEAATERGEEPFAAMAELARLLHARRRGLALETGEVRIILTPDELRHHVKYGTVATRMIEAFMVAANEAVAVRLAGGDVAQLFRCHALPDRIQVERFNAQMRTVGLPVQVQLPPPAAVEGADAEGVSVLELLKKGQPLTLVRGGFLASPAGDEASDEAPEPPPPPRLGLAQLSHADQDAWLAPFRAALAQINALKDATLRELVHVKLLACMGRAYYTPDNVGHFGLGSTCYHHFTSPIRRYPDLVCHRQLRALIQNAPPPHNRDELLALADRCSDQGSLAGDLERSIVQVALLMEERKAQRAWPRPGLVIGLTRGAVYVALGEGLEARIFSNDIPGGPWSVDENESYMFSMPDARTPTDFADRRHAPGDGGERIGLKLGDRILVTNAGFDYVDGRILAKLAG